MYEENTRKICRALALQKDVPFSPAVHFNEFLSDDVHDERWAGINGGIEILKRCDVMYVYTKHGISEGMRAEIEVAKKEKIQIVIKDYYPWESIDA